MSLLHSPRDKLDAAVLQAYGRADLGPVPWGIEAARSVLTEATLNERFTGRGPWKKRLPQILQTLEAVGRARAEPVAGGLPLWRGA